MFTESRNAEYITRLQGFVENVYGLDILDFSEAERGYYGETWNIRAGNGRFFLKIVYFPVHKERYERSFPAVEYMNREGIDFISRIVPTKDGRLCTPYQHGILGLFRFVYGTHTEKYPLSELFRLLSQIYRLPLNGLEMEREAFDCRYAEQFYSLLEAPCKTAGIYGKRANDIFDSNRQTLEECRRQLQKYAAVNESRRDHFVITSGDVGGNVIVSENKLTIIDWDYLLLAPPERDIWPYMQDEKQMKLLHEVFRENGITYRVRPERLAYYCYASFFYYLHAYLSGIHLFTREEPLRAITDGLSEFFGPDYWVHRCIRNIKAFS